MSKVFASAYRGRYTYEVRIFSLPDIWPEDTRRRSFRPVVVLSSRRDPKKKLILQIQSSMIILAEARTTVHVSIERDKIPTKRNLNIVTLRFYYTD